MRSSVVCETTEEEVVFTVTTTVAYCNLGANAVSLTTLDLQIALLSVVGVVLEVHRTRQHQRQPGCARDSFDRAKTPQEHVLRFFSLLDHVENGLVLPEPNVVVGDRHRLESDAFGILKEPASDEKNSLAT